MRRTLIVLSVVAMMVGGIAGVPASAGVADETVCLVADTGGFDDGSFNELALEGLQRADRRLGITADARQPAAEEEIPLILDELVTSGHCDLIIGVGFIVAPYMEYFVAAYPDQRFALIDSVFSEAYPNAAELLFRVDQAAFLAGFVAARISETGAIGVYGGAPIPFVTMFMDGYALGAAHFNARYGGSVDVLGWDPLTQTGLILDWQFQNPALGYSTTMELFDQGADTVFAVAGLTGFGSLEAAADRRAAGEKVRVIEPDFDWYTIDRDPSRILLTSVLKQVDVAVYNNIEALITGTWSPGWNWEDLASGGVDIAPFHKTRNQVRAINRQLRMLRAGIIDGTIDTLPYELP